MRSPATPNTVLHTVSSGSSPGGTTTFPFLPAISLLASRHVLDASTVGRRLGRRFGVGQVRSGRSDAGRNGLHRAGRLHGGARRGAAAG